MADNIKLEVVTPEKDVVKEDAQIVMAPGSLGEFGVLVGHTPFMTTLKTGTVKYTDGAGKERFVFVSGGFAEALPEKVTILAESAERRSEIDVERAKAAMQRAQERIDQSAKDEAVDFTRAKAALTRAISRLNIAQGN